MLSSYAQLAPRTVFFVLPGRITDRLSVRFLRVLSSGAVICFGGCVRGEKGTLRKG